VVGCISVTGACIPPLIIYAGIHVMSNWGTNYPEALFAATESGLMDAYACITPGSCAQCADRTRG